LLLTPEYPRAIVLPVNATELKTGDIVTELKTGDVVMWGEFGGTARVKRCDAEAVWMVYRIGAQAITRKFRRTSGVLAYHIAEGRLAAGD
jgi:hypothetical protein